MEIGIIANDLSDLTPVASALAHMVREESNRLLWLLS